MLKPLGHAPTSHFSITPSGPASPRHPLRMTWTRIAGNQTTGPRLVCRWRPEGDETALAA
jgi:hypothetical protein